MNRKIGILYKLIWPWWYLRSTFYKAVKTPFIPLKSGDLSQSEIVISFVGDMMGVGNREIVLGPEVKSWIAGGTHFCMNLESLVSTRYKLPLIYQLTKHYNFYDELKRSFPHVCIMANLANNHIDDLSSTEVDECLSHLSQRGIKLFGTKSEPTYTLAPDLKILGATTWYQKDDTLANCFEPQQIETNGATILYLHAGDEFSTSVCPELVSLERNLPGNVIALLGHHTHLPLPIENKKRFVAWSLGNFTIAFGGNPVRYGQIVKLGFKQMNGQWFINGHQWSFLKITPEAKQVKIDLEENCPFYQNEIVDKKQG
jgi:hypothetical protein